MNRPALDAMPTTCRPPPIMVDDGTARFENDGFLVLQRGIAISSIRSRSVADEISLN